MWSSPRCVPAPMAQLAGGVCPHQRAVVRPNVPAEREQGDHDFLAATPVEPRGVEGPKWCLP
jgi:hypothetical protein